MQGQIVKILSDTHFVYSGDTLYSCKCRGKFRNKHILPLVGDNVLFDDKQCVINDILPRKNALIRPSVANIDQGFIITSVKSPDFSPNLLDKLLVVMHYYRVLPIICLTKMDLLTQEEQTNIRTIMKYYEGLGYTVLENDQINSIKTLFKNKTSVLTGQTGAGKSTLLNKIDAKLNLETGEISVALGRGKHTTRCVSLLELYGGKVLDTPGFSSLDFAYMSKEEIRDGFIEFKKYPCLFQDCMHLREKECSVKKALANHKILPSRYETYEKIINQKQVR
ncbi:MAG: ribosome small subunit-dependent GTPase A [Bacilli bacterium]